MARASARGRPQDVPNNRGPGVLVSTSLRTRNVFSEVFIPPGLNIQDSPHPPQYPRRSQSSPTRCPDDQSSISPGLKHSCTRFPQPQGYGHSDILALNPGVPASYSSNIQEFPSPPASQQASPTCRTPSLIYLASRRAPGTAWGRPGGAEGRPHRPRAGRDRRGSGCGARLSAPTVASQTWRRGDSAGGRGRGRPEPRPPSLHPTVQTSASPHPRPFPWEGVPSNQGFGPVPPEPQSQRREHRSPGTVSRPHREELAPQLPQENPELQQPLGTSRVPCN